MQFFQAHATQFVALHAPAKFALWPIVFLSVQRNKIWSKNVAATLQTKSNKFDFVAVLQQQFSCCRR